MSRKQENRIELAEQAQVEAGGSRVTFASRAGWNSYSRPKVSDNSQKVWLATENVMYYKAPEGIKAVRTRGNVRERKEEIL